MRSMTRREAMVKVGQGLCGMALCGLPVKQEGERTSIDGIPPVEVKLTGVREFVDQEGNRHQFGLNATADQTVGLILRTLAEADGGETAIEKVCDYYGKDPRLEIKVHEELLAKETQEALNGSHMPPYMNPLEPYPRINLSAEVISRIYEGDSSCSTVPHELLHNVEHITSPWWKKILIASGYHMDQYPKTSALIGGGASAVVGGALVYLMTGDRKLAALGGIDGLGLAAEGVAGFKSYIEGNRAELVTEYHEDNHPQEFYEKLRQSGEQVDMAKLTSQIFEFDELHSPGLI